MELISVEFCFVTILILIIFIINISQILYLIIYKPNKKNSFYRLILFNYSFSSLIISIWLIPFFYFRSIWSLDSLVWRVWSYLYHITDAIQIYSLLLLITNTNINNNLLQKFFICLTWLAPAFLYSPLLWLTSTPNVLDYLPYRRFMMNIPWWILPIIYSIMYLLPLILSVLLIGQNICWPWIVNQYKKRIHSSERRHRENMAELTSLVETVLNFELDQSTINSWIIPSNNPSLSYISNKSDPSSLLFDNLTSSSSSASNDTNNQKQDFKLNDDLLFILTCLLSIVHVPYVILSLMNIYVSKLPLFIYIHWLGTIFIPIINLQKNKQ